jgi:hypothetical protein
MTGDRDGQAAGKATLLVIAVDGILGTHKCQRCCRVAGSPRAMRLVMVVIAAQRIMASEVAGSRS